MGVNWASNLRRRLARAWWAPRSLALKEAGAYVGTDAVSGRLQFDLLKHEGCLPSSTVPEIGCGALHAAVPAQADPTGRIRQEDRQIESLFMATRSIVGSIRCNQDPDDAGPSGALGRRRSGRLDGSVPRRPAETRRSPLCNRAFESFLSDYRIAPYALVGSLQLCNNGLSTFRPPRQLPHRADS